MTPVRPARTGGVFFCKYICTYCDFCKKHIKNQPVEKYIDCLIKEIKEYKIELIEKGFNNAFVVAFLNGERISIEKAIKLVRCLGIKNVQLRQDDKINGGTIEWDNF